MAKKKPGRGAGASKPEGKSAPPPFDPSRDGRTRAGRAAKGMKKNGRRPGLGPSNPDGRPPTYSDEIIIEALRASGGLVWAASKVLGCVDQTIRNRAKKSPAVREAIRFQRNLMVDEAEAVIRNKVAAQDLKAAIFVCRTLGRKRGYVEQQEHRIGGDAKAPPLLGAAAPKRLTPADLPAEVLEKLLDLMDAKAAEPAAVPPESPPEPPEGDGRGQEVPDP